MLPPDAQSSLWVWFREDARQRRRRGVPFARDTRLCDPCHCRQNTLLVDYGRARGIAGRTERTMSDISHLLIYLLTSWGRVTAALVHGRSESHGEMDPRSSLLMPDKAIGLKAFLRRFGLS